MAQISKHPIAAPPAPPARQSTRSLVLRAYVVFVVVVAMTASGWTNLLGPLWFGVFVGTFTAVTMTVWALVPVLTVRSPRDVWRRLPWATLGYVAIAGLSIAWSAWPSTSFVTWLMLLCTTINGLFIASVLTWREIVRVLVSALRWALGLSLLFELFVSLVLQRPLLPLWVTIADPDPHAYWSRDNLLSGGVIQGIVGNSALLSILASFALIVFLIAVSARIVSVAWTIPWVLVALFLLWRTSAATPLVGLVVVTAVAVAALIMRTAIGSQRTVWYAIYAAIAVAGALFVTFGWSLILQVLGKGSDLTGRFEIWAHVRERADQRPFAGWGFATPWLPWDPMFDGWIVDHGMSVFHAHDMWLDVYLQLGLLGVLVLLVAIAALVWRSWFFAVDRPRWDLDEHRPFTAISLLPILTITLLLMQGLTESRPLMEWGWLCIVMLAFKIKASPIVGVGRSEQSLALERGELPVRAR